MEDNKEAEAKPEPVEELSDDTKLKAEAGQSQVPPESSAQHGKKQEKKTMQEFKAEVEGKKDKKRAPKAPAAFVLTTGKRKRSIARAVTKPGKGLIKINSIPLNLFPYEMIRLRIMEPLIIAGDAHKNYDISVNVKGGGQWGQADAARQAIAKGLVEYLPDLKPAFVGYDRNLIAYDPRRTEPHKPPHSSWGPRRYKQRSKR